MWKWWRGGDSFGGKVEEGGNPGDGHNNEDAWTIAGRDPQAKVTLLAARAAGVQDDIAPAALAGSRFRALEEEQVKEEPVNPPGQPDSPFFVEQAGVASGGDAGGTPFGDGGRFCATKWWTGGGGFILWG